MRIVYNLSVKREWFPMKLPVGIWVVVLTSLDRIWNICLGYFESSNESNRITTDPSTTSADMAESTELTNGSGKR